MKPRRGEKPPQSSNSRSHSCLGVRSQEGQLREAIRSSAACLVSTRRLMRLPPCGTTRPWDMCVLHARFIPSSLTYFFPLSSITDLSGGLRRKVEDCPSSAMQSDVDATDGSPSASARITRSALVGSEGLLSSEARIAIEPFHRSFGSVTKQMLLKCRSLALAAITRR